MLGHEGCMGWDPSRALACPQAEGGPWLRSRQLRCWQWGRSGQWTQALLRCLAHVHNMAFRCLTYRAETNASASAFQHPAERPHGGRAWQGGREETDGQHCLFPWGFTFWGSVPSALLQADSAHDTGFMLSLSSLTGAKLSWSFAPLLAVGRSLVEGVLSLFQHAVTAGKQKHRGPVA